MGDRDKTLGEWRAEIQKGLQELRRYSLLGIIEELEERLMTLKRNEITNGMMEKAAELSVCEAMATVIKHFERGEEDEI